MEIDCPVCKNPFEQGSKFPMIVCDNLHLCCMYCVSNILDHPQTNKACPLCQAPMTRKGVKKFRLFERWRLQFRRDETLRVQNAELRKILQASTFTQRQENKKDVKPIEYESSNENLKVFKQIKIKEDRKYLVYKAIIERNGNNDNNSFIGLGSKEEEKGLSQNLGIKWYEDNYKLSTLCFYDQLALEYMLKPHYKQQKQWYQRMVQKNHLNFKALYGLALTEHNYGNVDEALKLYQKVTDINPNFDKPYEMMGFIYLEKEDYINAKKSGQQCLSKNSSNMFAQFIVGCSAKPEDEEYIIQRMSQMTEKYPKYVRPLHRIGLSLMKQQRYKQAKDEFYKCYRANQNYIDAYFDLADARFAQEEYQSCYSILQQLKRQNLNLNPKQRFTLYHNLGVAYSHYGIKSESIKQFQKCFLFEQFMDKKTRKRIADLCLNLGSYEIAVREYLLCLTEGQQDIFFYSRIITCYLALSKFDAALEWLDKWLTLQPQNTYIHKLYAETYFQKQNFELCIFWAEICLKHEFQQKPVYKLLILSLQKVRKYEQALKRISEYVNMMQLTTNEFDKILQTKAQIIKSSKLNRS